MNNMTKKIPASLCAAAFCAIVLAGTSARANPVTGSIAFGAAGVTVNSPNLATATSFTVTGAFTKANTFGTYTAVAANTAVDFTGFVFNPPAGSVDPLWTFAVGSTTYSFDATTVTSFYNASLQQWDIGGAGIAMVTGLSATPGTWNVNLSQSGASFVFDSTAAAVPVPDGGSAMTLLGSALVGLWAFGRKFCC